MSRKMELLGILQEECAEVIHIISKIRRFGIHCTNLDGISNFDLLNNEVGDVLAIIELLVNHKDKPILMKLVNKQKEHKKLIISRYFRELDDNIK